VRVIIHFHCEDCVAEGTFNFGAEVTHEFMVDAVLIAREEAQIAGDPHCAHEAMWLRPEVAA
jgi:hypothetical protein